MIHRHISAVFAALATLGTLSPAMADTSPTASHGSVAGLLGYGFKDGANLGFGLRGGYTLPMNLYLGGTFVYHLGKSESFSTPTGSVETKANIYYVGGEVGYDLLAGPVVIRPYAGLGLVGLKSSTNSNVMGINMSLDGSDSKFGFWPGATFLYPIDNFFIGADTRLLIVSDMNTFSLFATGGLQF